MGPQYRWIHMYILMRVFLRQEESTRHVQIINSDSDRMNLRNKYIHTKKKAKHPLIY
jgi:hypothetical protein